MIKKFPDFGQKENKITKVERALGLSQQDMEKTRKQFSKEELQTQRI